MDSAAGLIKPLVTASSKSNFKDALYKVESGPGPPEEAGVIELVGVIPNSNPPDDPVCSPKEKGLSRGFSIPFGLDIHLGVGPRDTTIGSEESCPEGLTWVKLWHGWRGLRRNNLALTLKSGGDTCACIIMPCEEDTGSNRSPRGPALSED